MTNLISRQAVLDAIAANCIWENEYNLTSSRLKKAVESLPAVKQEPIDKSAMLIEIYMEGVNMSGEYQGCWVRFKDIERIIDKYMAKREEE